MILLTNDQAKQLDEIAINKYKISSSVLMENAGHYIAIEAISLLKNITDPTIFIICGKGNNGGDGFVAASILYDKGYRVNLHSITKGINIKGDSLQYYNKCKTHNIPMTFGLKFPKQEYPDLIVDGILGTGARGEISKGILSWIRWINKTDSKILSIDIPTGLNGSNGNVVSDAVKADRTVTFGFTKLGMILRKGPDYCGTIIEKNIGFPKILKDELNGINWKIFTEDKVKKFLKRPEIDSNKYTSGKVLIIAGSRGMTGAAILSSNAALRCGAGLTLTTSPESLNDIYENKIIEGLIFQLLDNNKGYLNDSHYDGIMEKVSWADSVLIGPGLGRHPTTKLLIEKLVKSINKPLVLDADGLYPFFGRLNDLSKRKHPLIITPHFGEFSYLCDINKNDIISEFSKVMDSKIKKFHHVTLVKQIPICTFSNTSATVNISGNPGMATAGTGDVLAGMIASFIAQGFSTFDSATMAAYIHGKASDKLLETKGYRGQLASDLLDYIPVIIKRYESP